MLYFSWIQWSFEEKKNKNLKLYSSRLKDINRGRGGEHNIGDPPPNDENDLAFVLVNIQQRLEKQAVLIQNLQQGQPTQGSLGNEPRGNMGLEANPSPTPLNSKALYKSLC